MDDKNDSSNNASLNRREATMHCSPTIHGVTVSQQNHHMRLSLTPGGTLIRSPVIGPSAGSSSSRTATFSRFPQLSPPRRAGAFNSINQIPSLHSLSLSATSNSPTNVRKMASSSGSCPKCDESFFKCTCSCLLEETAKATTTNTESSSSTYLGDNSKEVFEYLDEDESGSLTVAEMANELLMSGFNIKKDPRFKAFFDEHSDNVTFTWDSYKTSVPNVIKEWLGKSCRGEVCIANVSSFKEHLQAIYSETTASSSASLSVAWCTLDGQRGGVGDVEEELQLDGICRPLVYCLVNEEMGDEINQHVQVEPSGLEPHAMALMKTGDKSQPYNPLMVSGTLVCCANIEKQMEFQARSDTLDKFLSSLLGRTNTTSVQKKSSSCIERRTLDSRNRCLAYMLEDVGCFPEGAVLDEILDLYYQACDTECTLESLSLVAATLANGGLCPITSERRMSTTTVHKVLSTMTSCGMGTYSGEWTFHVGLPATSSRSGLLLVIVPGLMGFCTYDQCTTNTTNTSTESSTGIRFFKLLTSRFNFHMFDTLTDTVNSAKINPRCSEVSSDQMTEKLLSAAADGDVWEIRRLRSRGANLNAVNYDKRTAMHLAATEGRISAMSYLIRHHAEVNALDRFGNTPLSCARAAGNSSAVAVLASAGARRASSYNQKGITSNLRSNDAEEYYTMDLLEVQCFYAALNGDVSQLKHLASRGADLNARNVDQRTLLHIAASEGRDAVIEFLISNNVDRNPIDRHGNTPLACAIEKGNRATITLLRSRSGHRRSSCVNEAKLFDDNDDDEMFNSSEEEEDGDNDHSSSSSHFEMSHHSANRVFHSVSLNEEADDYLSAADLLLILRENGLMTDDPRLKQMVDNIRLLGPKAILSYDQYRHVTESGAILLEKAMQGSLVLPSFDDFCYEVETVFESARSYDGGKVADYIPQLAKVDPAKYGVAVCSTDGQRFSLGDSKDSLCIQSCSKVISYCMAVDEVGIDKVHYHVGCEPSGLSFNELNLMNRHEDNTRVPHNPMINAGAIVTSSLIKRHWPLHRRFEHVLNTYQELVGGVSPVGFDNSVCLSERATADRNFCLGYMMREADCLPAGTDLMETLEFYFQQCSITMNLEQMSVVAATLANGGICPITNRRIFAADTVQRCLSLMFACGMYDFSGRWGVTVGVPAKSGVSGALMVVIPNVLGICVWSPRLDTYGNSVKGVKFIQDFVRRNAFHVNDGILGLRSPIMQQAGAAVNRHSQVQELDDEDEELEEAELVESGAVEAVEPRSYLLFYAARNGNVRMLRQLKLMGADLNSVDYDGRTALHIAAAESKTAVVEYLLSQKCDANAKDRYGQTPITESQNSGNDAMVPLLTRSI